MRQARTGNRTPWFPMGRFPEWFLPRSVTTIDCLEGPPVAKCPLLIVGRGRLVAHRSLLIASCSSLNAERRCDDLLSHECAYA